MGFLMRRLGSLGAMPTVLRGLVHPEDSAGPHAHSGVCIENSLSLHRGHCCLGAFALEYSGNPLIFRELIRFMPLLSDAECLAFLQAGVRRQAEAEEALGILFNRYDRLLQCHLRWKYPALPDDDLSELSQETWLRTWKHLDSRVRPEAFRAWLYRVGDNLAIDLIRRKNTRAEASLGVHEPAERRPDHVHALAYGEQLQKCVEKMPERLRDFVQRLLNLESDDDIADALDKKKARVYQIKNEVKQLLLKCMEQTP